MHHCLACVYECYADLSMSIKEDIGDMRVARLGGHGGQMVEDIPSNYYIKSTKHYLACGVNNAVHLVNIGQSNHEEIFTAKNLDTICGNISMLKTPPCDKDKQLFECIKLALYNVKEKLDETERRIESINSK